MDDDVVYGMVESERRAVAELLAALTPEQADTPSLCEAWRVRDVVGHLYWIASTPTTGVVRDWVRAGGRTSRMMDQQAIAAGSMPLDELAERLAAEAGSRRAAPGFPPVGYLADVVVHHQDIRRPLGLPRVIPTDRLRTVLDYYTGANRFTGGKRRTRGLALVAEDVAWRRGEGPEVRGPGEAILMASVGRAAFLADLDGDGVPVLRSRMPA